MSTSIVDSGLVVSKTDAEQGSTILIVKDVDVVYAPTDAVRVRG